ncbi:ATP-dependent RNA helicase, partial [Thraustotheca clavata]
EQVLQEAKKLSKSKRKKLEQLEARKAKEAKREQVLQSLEKQQLPKEHLNLMYSTARLGHKETLRERLHRSINQEKAGITLSEDARKELYQEFTVQEDHDMEGIENTTLKATKSAINKPAVDNSANIDKKQAEKSSKKKKSVVNVVQMPSQAPVVATLETTNEETVSSTSQSAMMAKLLELRKKNEEKRKLKAQGEIKAAPVVDKYETQPKYVPEAIPLHTTSEMVALSESLPTIEIKKKLVPVHRKEDIQLARMQLPVCSSEQEIMEAISLNPVVILCGETGSGKTTQVPQFLYESGYGFDEHNPGMIGVTQPRRVAAVSTAQRVATELNVEFGKNGSVGYQIRYDNEHVGNNTRIKFMTDGILLKEIQQDFLLKKYSIILLDEAHERNVNTDILIGLLSRVAPFRAQMAQEEQEMYASLTDEERLAAPAPLKPLKLVIMSATLRVEDFTMNKTLFPTPPPVIKVDARQYPVSVHFNKVTELNDYVHAAYQKVSKIHRKLPDGAILVFLTGQREILQLCRKLRQTMGSNRTRKVKKISRRNRDEKNDRDWFAREHDDDDEEADVEEAELLGDELFADESDAQSDSEEENENNPEDDEGSTENSTPYVHVLPLYSMLANDEQMKVFEAPPEKHRLIVVATNVAETSLTIPGVRYVVDAGRTKERVYDLKTGISEFKVQWISKASADQRAGRAGRTGPGHCYRLYSSAVYENEFPKFSPPQLLCQPIEDVVLQMKAMGIERILNFPFPTPPESVALKSAMAMLVHLGALNMTNDTITSLGKTLAQFPVAARFAKMLLIAKQVGCLEYVIAVVASLTGQSPFVLALERKEKEADELEQNGETISPEEMDEDMAKEWKEAEEMRKHGQWIDEESDVLSMLRAAGAYAYSGGSSAFCEENHLHAKVMEQMLKLRSQLTTIVNKLFASEADYTPISLRPNMPPPSPEEQDTIRQIVAAGYLDHVAHRAPPGTITEGTKIERNCAYISCSGLVNEPLYIHPHSHVFTREPSKLPPYVVYNTVVRSSRACMKTVTAIEPDWIYAIAQNSPLCKLSDPLPTPAPRYNAKLDRIDCFVKPVYGVHQWELPVVQVEYPAGTIRYRWFARCLLDGTIVPSLLPFATRLKEPSASILRKQFDAKIQLLVMALERNNISSKSKLKQQWQRNPSLMDMVEARGFLAENPNVREFACGGTAAAINIVMTFVPNKIMFRQQLYGLSTVQAWKSLQEDGWTRLYRGVRPPLMQAAAAKSFMFGLYNAYNDAMTDEFGNHINGIATSHYAAFLSGTSEAVLTPFERTQTLLQTVKYNNEFKGAIDAFYRISLMGIREHYRGCTAILLRNGPSNVVFFGMRESVRDILPETTTPHGTLAADFVSGAVLGAFLSTLFFPLNVAKTRMQSIYGGEHISVVKALQLTYKERGHQWRHVYRGVHINFVRSLISWGIINSAYEKLKVLTE